MNDNETNIIDLREIFRILYKKKWVFFIVLPIVAVLSSIYIFSIPRYYYSETALAPEMETGGNTGGALGSLASNFGIDLGNGQTSDAIYPLLYPDLLSDNSFIVSLWNIKVSDAQDSIRTTYYDYLTNHQKSPWWAPAIGTVKKWFKSDDDDAAHHTFQPDNKHRQANKRHYGKCYRPRPAYLQNPYRYAYQSPSGIYY